MNTLRFLALAFFLGPWAWAQSGPGALIRTRIPVDASGNLFRNMTVPRDSVPLPNVGQGLHTLYVFASGAVADVTTSLCRIEATFECLPITDPACASSSWFPISQDLTTLRFVASLSLTFGALRANGSYPLLRVSCPTVDAAFPLEVRYLGSTFPIGNVFFDIDRWIIGSPFNAADKATFVLCLGSACTTGTNLTNEFIVRAGGEITQCFIFAKTAPTGASLIVDINLNGTTIFPASPKLVFPIGGAVVATTNVIANGSLQPLDRLTVDIDQIGSGTAGQDVTAVCTISQ